MIVIFRENIYIYKYIYISFIARRKIKPTQKCKENSTAFISEG